MKSTKLYPHVKQDIVSDNVFLDKKPSLHSLETFDQFYEKIPQPYWVGHDDAVACYRKTWEIAYSNIMNPEVGSGFVSPFIDTAFNGHLFMWDSCFILMFGRYGKSVFDFQGTLDNFYAAQHEDGFISREIHEKTGEERFERHDPSSTGPNIMAWCEWEYYMNFGDIERLKRIFPALIGYHRWMRSYRSWPDGSYWSTGFGCGMDNQPRCPEECDDILHHGFMSWVDATAQALLSAQLILKMGKELNTEYDLSDMLDEVGCLKEYINNNMWNDEVGFYTDRLRDGSLSDVISVGGYWPVLAGAVSEERLERMFTLLDDPEHFNRPHRIPTLSASHPRYNPENGGYWLGGVWAPTNYMVLRSLRSLAGSNRAAGLAKAIGRNHHDNVVEVFNNTGTLWENYAPEKAAQGRAKPDFVGWSGIGPVAVLFEEVFGLQPDIPNGRLVLDISLTDDYGVGNYPFGNKNIINLRVNKRQSCDDEPVVEVECKEDFELEVRWGGGSRKINVKASDGVKGNMLAM